MKSPKQIEKEAEKLFIQFQNKMINIDDFENKLIKLAKHIDFSKGIVTYEEFVDEYIKPQFNAYKESESNHYLLSVYSSGSLLNQFEINED